MTLEDKNAVRELLQESGPPAKSGHPIVRGFVWLVSSLSMASVFVTVFASPWIGMVMRSGNLRYDFAIALTSEAEPVATPAEHIAATYFPDPPPPPEPSFADQLAGALAQVNGDPADRHKLGEVFRQAAASIRRTFITTDLEATKFIASGAAHELGDHFDAWKPFLNFYAESLSELKRGGQIGDNDMQALAEICAETATLLTGGSAQ